MVNALCRIHQHIKWVSTPDGGVLLDPYQGIYFSVNPVGATIVEDLLSGIPSDQIIGHILERYPVEEGRARDDYANFITLLKTKQLCEVV